MLIGYARVSTGEQDTAAQVVALALDPEVHHALATLDIAHPDPAQLLTAHAVIEQGGQDGPVAHTLERVSGGGASSSLRACVIAWRKDLEDAAWQRADDYSNCGKFIW
jgi:hypothetical protein